jgi:hypothetical protein
LVLLASGAALPLGASAPRAGAASPPLRFEPNRGQAGPSVEFLARAPGYTFMLKRGAGAACVMPRGETISLELAGAASPSGLAEAPLPSVTHYYGGADPAAWRAGIPHYARVRYPRVYPGIDFLWRGRQKELEYELVVGRGADPERIGLRFRGARRIRLDRRGHLVLETASGELRFRRPFAYQREGERRRQVMVRYRVAGDLVTFRIGPWDRSRELLIDPVLSFSSYLGGAGFDAGYGIAADSSGNIYVSGETASADFPLPAGGTRTARANRDAFVTKLSADGSVLLYTTILSSRGNDAGRAIAVDGAGNAYIAGVAGSNFPVTTGALRTSPGGQEDGFVAKLDPAGRLVYATYLGDAGADFAAGIAVDSSGNAYVTGYTSSLRFPTTPGAPQTAYQGGYYDAFLVKLDASGRTLLYSTLLGGPGNDLARAVAVDAAGNACLAGYTDSLSLPVRNAFKSTPAGGGDALVACLNASGTAWNYLTYFGGTSMDEAYGVAVDAAGNAYVAGATFSGSFPVSPGAFQGVKRGDYDAFVAKFSPSGALVYSTLLGGGGTDAATAVAVDRMGRAWIAGFTNSLDFPMRDAWQTTNRGSFDAFVAQLNADGASLMVSSYLGGTAEDRAFGLALDGVKNVFATGWTASTDFPSASGVVQRTARAPYNGFVTETVANQAPAVITATPGRAIAVDGAGSAYVTGRTNSAKLPPQLPYQTNQGGWDVFVAKLALPVAPCDFDGNDFLWQHPTSGDLWVWFMHGVVCVGHAPISGPTE